MWSQFRLRLYSPFKRCQRTKPIECIKVNIYSASLRPKYTKYTNTRLLGHFAPIFYFNCEHFLFVYIVKQKQKNVYGFYHKIFAILIMHKQFLAM